MQVTQLTIDPFTKLPMVILQAVDGHVSIPVDVGMSEASTIAAQLERVALDRPMTHDLIKEILVCCGADIERVELDDARGGTMYAALVVKGRLSKSSKRSGRAMRPRRPIRIDARPSDAIAVALRTGAPIFVRRKVLDYARGLEQKALPRFSTRQSLPYSDSLAPTLTGAAALSKRELKQLLATLSDENFGKWKM